jgi:dimethylglycine dehydrogenase
MHRRWFESKLGDARVSYANVSDRLHGFAIAGPRSRELLSRLTRDDVSADAFKFRDVRRTFVGGVPVYLLRLSFSGELGYEIYCEPQFHLALWEQLEQHGQELGLMLYGARALMSLRLEKLWGVWTLDYRPDFTAAESGLDVFIDWSREFIGREAALAERATGPVKRLVTMTIDVDGQDVVGDEAILCGDACIGHVTSGGFAHHVGASVAFGYVSTAYAGDGQVLSVEIDGQLRAARVCTSALYDPKGLRMRA